MSNITYGPKLGKLINAYLGDNYTDDFRTLLRALDQLIMPSVLSMFASTPPSSPSNGDAYIVASGGISTWLGMDGLVAVYSTEITTSGTNTKVPGWEFYTPQEGWQVWVTDIRQSVRYSTGAWSTIQQGFSDEETPGGAIDGVNLVFSIAHTPNPAKSFKLYADGARLQQQLTSGGPGDYTLVGTVLTYLSLAPVTTHVCDYRY